MKKVNRREFLGSSAVAMAVGPAAMAFGSQVLADDNVKVDSSDPQAKALSYVHSSAQEGENCANCQLYTGVASAEWGPCAIFPGKQVAGAGWCSAWVKKAN